MLRHKRSYVHSIVALFFISSVVHGAPGALERALRNSLTGDITLTRMGDLFQMREHAPNPAIRSHVLKACGSGLCYLGKMDTYNKNVRSQIPQVATFEKSLFVDCVKCNGAGKLQSQCSKCAGDGRCKNTSCSGGTTTRKGFDGRVTRQRCGACKGTGRCQQCGGTGVSESSCNQCGGHGGIFDNTQCLAVFRKEVNAAVAGFDEINAVDLLAKKQQEEEKAQKEFEAKKREQELVAMEKKQEFEERMREEEIKAKKEAVIAEAAATGAEKAKQAALLERERLEKKMIEEEAAKYAGQDQVYLKSVVIIDGDRGKGSGFLCVFRGKKVVMSNAHVLCGNRKVTIKSLHAGEVKYGDIYVCKDRDIVLYDVSNAGDFVYMSLYDRMDKLTNREKVVVLGNSEGAGVATTLRGKMKGIGPETVEVDATFVRGNSGSPIIAYDYDAVVGVATLLQRNPQVDWTNKKTRFAETRRLGVRLDNVTWKDFSKLDRGEYEKALDVYDEMATLYKEIMEGAWQGRYHATVAIRARMQTMLDKYTATPQWMRKYSHDALLTAYFFALLLQ